MAHLSPHLEHTPGPLDVEALEPAELEFFLGLPVTLQELLRRWNGAFFDGEACFGTGVEVGHEGPNHPDHDAGVEAANGGTVVRLHDDFGVWVLSTQPFADADE